MLTPEAKCMTPTLGTIGILLIFGGMIAFCVSYCLVVKKQEFLLGSLTMLWFRCLTWIVLSGLILLGLDAVNRLVFTTLFWRR
jgi:hypothetical protein